MTHPPSQTAAQIPLPTTYPVQPGTFQSLLPQIDALLELIYRQSTSHTHVTPSDAIESITTQARELARTLEGMKRAAVELPGGNLSSERIGELTRVLEVEGEKRRAILRGFGGLELGLVDKFAGEAMTVGEEGEDGVLAKE